MQPLLALAGEGRHRVQILKVDVAQEIVPPGRARTLGLLADVARQQHWLVSRQSGPGKAITESLAHSGRICTRPRERRASHDLEEPAVFLLPAQRLNQGVLE